MYLHQQYNTSYPVPDIQEAALAATAAASGSAYPSYMTENQTTSELKQDHAQQQSAQPLMQHVQVPTPPSPPIHNHGVTTSTPAMRHMHNVVPPQEDSSPLYVNAKQFHRILKRRVTRQKLDDQRRSAAKRRKPYLHESRHNHAMRRPRGPGGRFLTNQEIANLPKKLDPENTST